MKKILLTGSTGFIGSNVLPVLQKNAMYEIKTPARTDLNLKSEREVSSYLERERFDVVVHFANPTPAKNPVDLYENLLEDSLRIFLNFYNHSDLFGKMIYTGSGAEYGKTRDLDLITEERCFSMIPEDPYGLGKYVMNRLACQSRNVFNFRIFACFGPNDMESKFITHCIRSVLRNQTITIRKDCEFDYIHVFDFARYIEWGINAELKHHDYNVTSGIATHLTDIAKLVLEEMHSELGIRLLSDEHNTNYSANNRRIVEESGIRPMYSLREGIRMQIEWERALWGKQGTDVM